MVAQAVVQAEVTLAAVVVISLLAVTEVTMVLLLGIAAEAVVEPMAVKESAFLSIS